MCIIYHKPVGKTFDNQLLRDCFITNRDGAGFMYPEDGKVVIKKGFMDYASFIKALQDTVDKLGGTSKYTPIVCHFRIGTQGGVVKGLTHPYPITRSFNAMKQTDTKADIAMCHNGVIRSCSSSLCTTHNDSMQFIADFAFDIIEGDKKFYTNKCKMRLLNRLRETSRLCFMTGDGHVEMLGDWYSYEGAYFSHPAGFLPGAKSLCEVDDGVL